MIMDFPLPYSAAHLAE